MTNRRPAYIHGPRKWIISILGVHALLACAATAPTGTLQKLTGDQVQSLIIGRTIEIDYTGTEIVSTSPRSRSFLADGVYIDRGDLGYVWRGVYRIDGDKLCTRPGSKAPEYCADFYYCRSANPYLQHFLPTIVYYKMYCFLNCL